MSLRTPHALHVALALALALALAFGATSCRTVSSLNPWREVPTYVRPEKVPEAIERANNLLAEGRTATALEWMRSAQRSRGLTTDMRNDVQATLEHIAQVRLEELSEPGSPPGKLADLLDLELPRQIAVTAGIRAARGYLDQGRAYKGFRVIEKVDKQYPTHHERAAAGAFCADAGFELAERPGKFLWIWTRWSRPTEVLEYLVLNYPSEPRCDQGYAKLAELYEQREHFALAIERHQDLLLYHPGSPLVPYSEAAIPHLRLVAIESPVYNRSDTLKARSELEKWLGVHGGSPGLVELEEQVRTDLDDSLRRLAESDLDIARFYRRVGNDEGLRWHAERALETARAAEDEERESEALALLEHGAAEARPLPRDVEETEGQEARPGASDQQ